MAKRKKTYSRRRKVGAFSLSASSPLVKFGSIAAGYFLGGKLNDLIEKQVGDKVDGKIIGAVEAGVGIMLMIKGKKTIIKTALSGFMLGMGAKKILTEFGVINGFQDMPVLGGYGDVNVLNGYRAPGQINGGFTVPQSISQTVMGGIPAYACNSGSGINETDR